MAFVRWRGNCAQLLMTVNVDGRPRQRLLANLQGAYATTPRLWARVAEAFPDVVIDWAAVDRALAVGPPSAPPPTAEQLQWATVAHQLLVWATTGPPDDPRDGLQLEAAAEVLARWQSYR